MFSLPGWPGGDPPKIDDASEAWKTLSAALDPVFSTCNSTITALEATWSGKAQAQFNTVWSAFHKQYGASVSGTKDTSEALAKVSEKLNDAHKEYEHTVAITVAAIAVSLALSWCTFGASDVAAGEEAASGIAVIDTICTVLGNAIVDLAGDWIAPELLASIVLGGGISFVDSVGEQSAESVWNGHHWSVNWFNAAEAGVFGAVGGGIGGKYGDIDSLPGKLAFSSGLGFVSGAGQQGINFAEGKGFDWNKVIASTIEEGLTGGLEHNHASGRDDDSTGGSDDGGTHDDTTTGGTHDDTTTGGTHDDPSTGGGKHEADTAPDSPSQAGAGGGGKHEADTPPDSPSQAGAGGGGKHEAPTGAGKHEANTPVDSPSLAGVGGGRHLAN